MTLKEAFKHQIENTRLLIEDDLKPDDAIYLSCGVKTPTNSERELAGH